MARLHSETIPTSTLAATARVVDGFVTTQTDHQGITKSFTRAYTATGITQTATDGRGNTTTTHTDLAGRSISSTDAAGNTTTTVYDEDFDQPSVISNAQGKTACYKYDLRGRKVAEWGTAIQSPRRLVGGLDKCAAFAPKGRAADGAAASQSDRGLGESLDKRAAFAPKGRGRNGVRPSQPALFGYDDAGNLTALTTFRADSGDITTDPSGRTDGDTTTWVYHSAAGVELSKTYADNSQVVKTYDAFNRLATETNARGIVKTLSYDAATGLLTGISFSDEATPSLSFAYNILGQLTQVTDAAGTRTIAYNEYSEQQSDSLNSGAHTHLVTELCDSYDRSTGFTYARSGFPQFTTSVGYATDGRIATAGFMHGGVNRQFSYSYLSGSNLLHTLTHPNGLTLTQSYEEHRDLLTGMQYHRGSTLVVERSYSYDKAPDGCKGDWTNAQHLPEGRGAVGRLRVTLGRPTNRSTARQGSVKNDTFTHNDRSELVSATLGTDAYSYSEDKAPDGCKGDWTNAQHLPRRGEGAMGCARVNIGNRKTAQEAAEEATAYDANNLNQYTAIQEGTAEAFVPTFDADGKAPDGCKGDWTNAQHLPEGRGAVGRLRVNQTKVKTSTGIWNVVYNAENRPVTFTSEDGATIVECTYDKAPEGPEGDWTNAQRLPEGRGAVGRLRVNMGRRHTRKITVNDNVTNHLRYIYRGYLQIAAINAVSGAFQWFIRRESARRPPKGRLREQAVRAIGQTRSVCPAGARSREAAPSQVFSSGGTILTAYTYTPYGSVTANGNVTQPIQWSSEYSDSELGLVYYNYRHYNPADGRWIGRDPAPVEASQNNYCYVLNRPSRSNDLIGLAELPCDNNHLGWYRKLEVKILADFMIGDPFELANTSSFTDMVGDFLQGEKEKALDELFKDDEVYAAWKKLRAAGKKIRSEFDKLLKAKRRFVFFALSPGAVFTKFFVEASAEFCCCKKNEGYYFNESVGYAETKGDYVDLRAPNVSDFQNHIDQLPRIFKEAAEQLQKNACS